jgi:hypothetical protein
MKAHGLKQVRQRRPHRFVIVNDENDLFGIALHSQPSGLINK